MIKEFTATIVEKKQLTHDTIFLSLEVPEDFTFNAGQYIFFKIKKGDEEQLRPYSILSHPAQKGQLDFCIKLIDNGFASETFKVTKVGDDFTLRGPLGHFIFDEKAKEHFFVCGGTGIAPMYSMLKEHLNHDMKFTLLFGVKYKKDLFFHRELEKLDEENDNFTYIPTLTREEWEGKTGRVHEYLPENLQNKTFYICGLKELVLDTKEKLTEKGVSKEKIHFERYT